MYYRRKLKIALMMVLVLVLSVSVAWAGGQKEEAGDEEVYINGIDPDFPPFGYVDEEGNPAGFDVESVNWIAEEMGFEVKHQPTAWDGIIEALRAGKIDFIASGMSILPEREEVISFTIPYWETKLAIAVKEDSDLSYEDTIDGEHTIGVQRGTTAAMWIEDNLIDTGKVDEEKVVNYDSFSLAVQDLINGRIDSAMQDDTMVIDAMKQRPIKIAGTHKSGMAYGYGVRQEDDELREMLNEGIRRLQESDRWEELKEKYDM
ncbi:MAG: transporter substrate-binding domain-containing protein [Spirochaetaceae bacterium]